MNRQLLLLRHGKSDWDIDINDFDRPLKKRGKLAVQRMGLWLEQQHLIPDYILCSPAERAKSTAENVCHTMGLATQLIHYDDRIYAASLKELLDVLASCPQKPARVLLIGHNPGFESLLSFLNSVNTPIPKDGKLLPTATLATLDMPQDWHALTQGCAELLSITRPSDIIV